MGGGSSPRLEPLLAAGRSLGPLGVGLDSALAAEHPPARYDRHAPIYDRLIANRAYNGLLWGLDPAAYRAFAAEAVATGSGPLLDAGCGTAVFTADAYRAASRPLVLTDLSRAMLERAVGRLQGAPAALVQADIYDLPFRPQSFSTVVCFTMLHVLDDPWAALTAVREHLAPGGAFFASMLVDDRAVGRAYMRVLRRSGELGPPRSARDLAEAARDAFGHDATVDLERTGSAAWLRVRT